MIAIAVDLAALTNALVLALIGAITAWTAWRTKKNTELQKQDSVVIEQTHKLVNSNMGTELLTGMVAARSLAHALPTPENNELLNVAERKYREHEANQAIADQVKT